jgi:CheY-like chemotaxis protein
MMNTQEPLRILFLEDNPPDVELVERALLRSGLDFTISVTDSKNGYTRLLDEFKPDLILSDYSLPTFDALAAFTIKQEKGNDAPFIIVSGMSDEDLRILLKKGISDYVLKDDLSALSSKITLALKKRDEARNSRGPAE